MVRFFFGAKGLGILMNPFPAVHSISLVFFKTREDAIPIRASRVLSYTKSNFQRTSFKPLNFSLFLLRTDKS